MASGPVPSRDRPRPAAPAPAAREGGAEAGARRARGAGGVDLHTHSRCSDGSLAPAAVVERAAAAGLAAVSLTDHDTTAGLAEAAAAALRLGLESIPGVEVSTNHEGQSVHVLGHGFPPHAPLLAALLARVQADRVERNRRMLARLAALGFPLEEAEVARHATGSIVARPHFARALVLRGYVRHAREAFDRLLADGRPAYVVVDRPPPAQAVRQIGQAGGVATIAHPRQVGLADRAAWEAFLGPLADAGLAGLEVDHPSHAPPDRAFFRELARAFDLVPTGGSDFHGEAKPGVEVGRGDGTIAVPYAVWTQLAARRRPGPETP